MKIHLEIEIQWKSTLFNSFYSRSLTKYKVAEKTYSSPPLSPVHIKVLKAIRWGKMISEVRCTYFMCTCVFTNYFFRFQQHPNMNSFWNNIPWKCTCISRKKKKKDPLKTILTHFVLCNMQRWKLMSVFQKGFHVAPWSPTHNKFKELIKSNLRLYKTFASIYIRCGRVVTDFLPYPKFRKSLLSWWRIWSGFVMFLIQPMCRAKVI